MANASRPLARKGFLCACAVEKGVLLRRTFFILSAVLAALAVAPLATAGKPTQETISGPDDLVVSGECAFPVLMHVEGVGIITTFTDKKGNVVSQNFHFPNNKTVFTNLVTGESLTVATTGPASSGLILTGRHPSKSRAYRPGLATPSRERGESS